MKRCPLCGESKALSKFHKNSQTVSGLSCYCAQCQLGRAAEYRAKLGKAAMNERNRRNYTKHGEHIKAYSREYKHRNAAKRNAHTSVNLALKSEALTRPDVCSMCGEFGRLDAHHESYKEKDWRVVTWLCRTCHKLTHANSKNRPVRQSTSRSSSRRT